MALPFGPLDRELPFRQIDIGPFQGHDFSAPKTGVSAQKHGEMGLCVYDLRGIDQFLGESIVIAATNHPALLDEAVWRRFDEVVAFPLPETKETAAFLELKLRSTRFQFSLHELAGRMGGLTFAEVEVVCDGALRRQVLDGRTVLEMSDVERGLRRMEERRRAIQAFEDPNLQ